MLPKDTALPCASLSLAESDKLFFSESPKRIEMAKALCAQCPATQRCLEYALENEIEFGIFGATTPLERKALANAVSN